MNNKEKLYLAKSAMTEDNKNHLSSWIRGGTQPQSPAASKADITGPSYTPTINNGFSGKSSQAPTRYNRNFQNKQNPNLQTHGNFGNAVMANPVGRGSVAGLNDLLSTKQWGEAASTLGNKTKQFVQGESGLVDWMNNQGPSDYQEGDYGAGDLLNTMNPRPLVDGALGIGYDIATGADAFRQGAAGGGYTRPEWSKEGPSFVGGVGALGTSMYNDPLGTLGSMATGEGAAFNFMGGAGAVGKGGVLGRLSKNPVKTVKDGLGAGARSLKSPTKTFKNYRKVETNTAFDTDTAPQEKQVVNNNTLATGTAAGAQTTNSPTS
jgi:hypothetical protein